MVLVGELKLDSNLTFVGMFPFWAAELRHGEFPDGGEQKIGLGRWKESNRGLVEGLLQIERRNLSRMNRFQRGFEEQFRKRAISNPTPPQRSSQAGMVIFLGSVLLGKRRVAVLGSYVPIIEGKEET